VAIEHLTRSDIEAIIEIIKSAKDIEYFSLNYEGIEIRISRRSDGPPPAVQHAAGNPPNASILTGASAGPTGAEAARHLAKTTQAESRVSQVARENMIVVKAPMVGTFYRSPAPGEPPFIEVGQEIKPDTVLCIIEVMKLMNSIFAETSGVVKEILAENAEPVEFGQALIVIEPKA